jgi:hypothetical protein
VEQLRIPRVQELELRLDRLDHEPLAHTANQPPSAVGAGVQYDKSRTTVPPASRASLAGEAYAEILAYILEVNGIAAGAADLPPGGDALTPMRIP